MASFIATSFPTDSQGLTLPPQLGIKLTIAFATGLLFTGCQSLPAGLATALPNTATAVTTINTPPLNHAESQATLMSALKKTLYHNQDWVTYQQLSVLSVADLPASDTPTWVKIEKCQSEHDRAYIQQLKADQLDSNLDSSQTVAKLSKEKSQPYNTLKTAYLACTHTAKLEQTLASTKVKAAEAADKTENIESSATSSAILQDTSGWLKLDPSQAKLMNRLVSNSASIQYTGIYRPLQGRIAVQADAGFDNKNLHYHYRLPLVLDINLTSLYVKPDILMPFVSIYLDNQLGTSWQDKWYKFSEAVDKKLPARLIKTAVMQAIKTSVNTLPASQFSSVSPTQIQTLAQQVAMSVPQNTQPLSLTRQPVVIVIEWRQTDSEQAAFFAQIKQAFISNMDNAMQTDRQFLALSPAEQAQYRTHWQAYKTRLMSHTLNQNNSNRLKKLALHTQKGQGQTLVFVLENGALKHIYQQQLASFSQKPFRLTTWHTFAPNTQRLATANQPSTLATLVQTIHDMPQGGNVLDGQQEIQRIKQLDDSRRLFGRQAGIFKSYDEYKKIDTPAAKKAVIGNSAPILPEKLPEKMPY